MKRQIAVIATFLVRKALKQISTLVLVCFAVLSVETEGQMLTNLYQFSGSDGSYPVAGLAQGSDGNFYSTTYQGGTNGAGLGSVFRISPSGSFTNLYQFRGTDGSYPVAGLVQGSDGSFYGTTSQGGNTNLNNGLGDGTVFRISPSGSFTNLHQFSGTDGYQPLFAGLVQGSDGYFYGTTSGGGTNGYGDGTVFRISPSGSFTNLYQFSGTDGAYPNAGLVQGSDGYFYGTTFEGGNTNLNNGYGDGTVFRISPSGSFTNLYQFSGTDGAYPEAGLMQGSDGNFYGTTDYGGNTNLNNGTGLGTVFRISPSGSFTNLYQFSGSDGNYPRAGLVQGSDGSIYGTTVYGGNTNLNNGLGDGTVFRIGPSGSFTNLYQFSGTDGVYPSRLVQGSDGDFYGTTSGGDYNLGTVFKLSLPLSPPANQIAGIELFSVFGDTYTALSIPSVAGEIYQLQYSDSMNPANWINSGDPIKSIGGPLTTFDLLEPMTPQRFYRFTITP